MPSYFGFGISELEFWTLVSCDAKKVCPSFKCSTFDRSPREINHSDGKGGELLKRESPGHLCDVTHFDKIKTSLQKQVREFFLHFCQLFTLTKYGRH